VRLSAKRIKNLPGRPVTKTGIVRDISDQDSSQKMHLRIRHKSNLKRLPQTAQAFTEVIESLNDYYLRKIAWAVYGFHQDGIAPSLTSLSKRASIKWGKWYLPEVNLALQASIDSFHTFSESKIKAA
jgi:hypothetical protein